MLALRERLAQNGAATVAGAGASDTNFQRKRGSAPLSSLAGEAVADRFRRWRGASGRGYVFSVYSAHACPAYSQAVIIVAAIGPDGGRSAFFIDDTGWFPEAVLARAAAEARSAAAEVEFHIHLLADSAAERRAVVADLRQAPRS